MTPAARYAAAIEILDRAMAGLSAERELTSWSRANRFAGSKDRAAVRDIVFDGLRNLRSFAHISGLSGARGVLVGRLMNTGEEVSSVFNGEGYAPTPLSNEELEIVNAPKSEMSRAVALDVPDWLEPLFDGDDDYSRLKTRAPIDLRVNTKKSNLQKASRALAADGIETDPVDVAKTALRVRGETRKIPQTASYKNGAIELQDAGSQALIEALDIPDRTRVLDYCAGGGGKTLAMGARGVRGVQFSAYDLDQDRLKALRERAQRADVFVKLLKRDPVKDGEEFDLVVLDVPCSGSGAWRRSPDAKWKLDENRLAALVDTQAQILSNCRELVSEKGVLAYMTCSLFRRENEGQIETFLAQNPAWSVISQQNFKLSNDSDGFFLTTLRKLTQL
jgi:16S rRNA (cytosine967-C5)-methyltransferase